MNEQLKQAIEEACEDYEFRNSEPNNAYFHGIEDVLSKPSILRHANHEIMKQAGWVREEDLKIAITAAWMMSQRKENNLTDCMDLIIKSLPQSPKQ